MGGGCRSRTGCWPRSHDREPALEYEMGSAARESGMIAIVASGCRSARSLHSAVIDPCVAGSRLAFAGSHWATWFGYCWDG